MRKYTVIPTRVANRHVSRDVTPEQYNVIGGNLLVSLEVHTVHQVKSWRQRRSARGAYGWFGRYWQKMCHVKKGKMGKL